MVFTSCVSSNLAKERDILGPKMTELDDIRRAPAVAAFEKEVQKVVEPYHRHLREGFARVFKLGRAAMNRIKPDTPGAKQRRETSDDIFRAIVVLTHAYLEDFLRTLAKA